MDLIKQLHCVDHPTLLVLAGFRLELIPMKPICDPCSTEAPENSGVDPEVISKAEVTVDEN